jgi:D-threo-aldose 1-dehydrogenase
MEEIEKRNLGKTSAAVSKLGFGGAGLGELSQKISEDQAQRVLQAAWDGGVRYFDTSPFYGCGQSEHRVGHFLRQQPRSEFIISTKVGRVLKAPRDLETFDGSFMLGEQKFSWKGGLPFEFEYDYSYDGIMRSYEDSLQRLGLPSVDLLLIHDLDFLFHQTEARVNAYLAELATSGWRALSELRSSGRIRGVGAGINELGMIPRMLDVVDLDFFLVALSYNLLDLSSLEKEFPLCAKRNVGVVAGAVYASGILATGPVKGALYNYAPASEEVLEKTRRMESVCQRHRTPLAAAALQFPLAHPLVASIVPGAIAPEQVAETIQRLRHPIPAALWSELKGEGLLPADAPTP